MNSLLKPTRRRFLLNSGILAAVPELSCARVGLSQGLAATPSCHDDQEPTVRETRAARVHCRHDRAKAERAVGPGNHPSQTA
jgi:hypothetical protein